MESSNRQPKLLDRVRTAIRTRHHRRRTEDAYAHWIRAYIVFHGKTHPASLGAAEVTAFVSWLAEQRRVSASTQNQALSAVLFLYRDVLGIELQGLPPIVRARTPERLPVILSRDEVAALLRHLSGTMHLIVTLLYGAGLRLEECLELRIKDIDFDREQIVVRRGKRQKDRVTVLPATAKEALRAHLDDVRRIHMTDCANGHGRVVLPFAVARKQPSAAKDWRWQFVFPAARICREPRFGPPSRYHLHESAVQKAVAQAARRAGIVKRVGPHTLRSVSAWCPPIRDGSFQRQFVLSTDRAWEFAAGVDRVDSRLHCGSLQIDSLNHPRRTGDDLGGGQHAVGDEILDDRVADPEFARSGLQWQPRSIVTIVGESPAVSHVRDMMDAPRLAVPRSISQAIEDDRNRLVVADF